MDAVTEHKTTHIEDMVDSKDLEFHNMSTPNPFKKVNN